jgi:hypothetical protein
MDARRLAFADCKTISLDPGPLSIWELAVITRDLDKPEDEDYEYLWQIRPDLAAANPVSLRVGGYYERCEVQRCAVGSVRRFPCMEEECGEKYLLSSTAELAHHVASLLDGATLVAANPAFDAGHLAALLHGAGECLTADYHYLDLGSMVRGWAAAQGLALPYPLKVADAARMVKIDPFQYDAHMAPGDVRMLRDVFDAVMAGGRS